MPLSAARLFIWQYFKKKLHTIPPFFESKAKRYSPGSIPAGESLKVIRARTFIHDK